MLERIGKIAAVALWFLLCAIGAAQEIRADGSSALYPLMVAGASDLRAIYPDSQVSVVFSGTSRGFQELCQGRAQLIGASRPISTSELELCQANGVEFIELPLAYDLITVVVHAQNDWVTCLSTEELVQLWREGSPIVRWSDLRPDWPNEEIVLHAPAVDSGTYHSFASALLAGELLRADFHPSLDGALLAEAVAADLHAVSFLAHSHYRSAGEGLRGVAVDAGSGCNEPVLGAGHLLRPPPLLRGLYLYVDASALEEVAAARFFVELLLSPRGRDLVSQVGFLPLEAQAHRASVERYQLRLVGPGTWQAPNTGLAPRRP